MTQSNRAKSPVKHSTSISDESLRQDSQDFSLVQGGPLFQLLRRSHLTDDALGLLYRRVIAISLFVWLPLLVLSALEGKMLGGGVNVPFLQDIEVHVRFLIATPLLIVAELAVHRRMRLVAQQFLERHLIPETAMARFNTAITSAFRLRNSVAAEVLLFAFVYGVGIMIVWRHYIAFDTATWYATPSSEGTKFSLAGIWYGYLSLPIFQFLLCRWYFRLFIWARFLWQVSRIDLNLMPMHPDRVGGLGFLSSTVYGFIPFLIAHGAMFAGILGNRIYHLGATLPDFKIDTVFIVVILMCVVLGPLTVFAPRLFQAKLTGGREYGSLAERYVQEFDTKWLRGGAPVDERLLGNGDIQSLADLSNSFEVVRTMRLVPFTKETVFMIATATLAPVAPLLFTMMPWEELLKKLFGMLF